MNWLEQITFYLCQIWSFIRFMFFGDVQISGRVMESELELILVTMKKVEELTTNIDQIQLNKQLCNYLGEGFTKKRAVLERAFASVSTLATTDQKKVLQEIHMVAKCAEALVQKCLCKESSWLDGAITLANVKEDVTEILLSLSWWTSVLQMTNVGMAQAILDTTEAVEKHDHLLEEFLSESSSLQVAAKVDMEYLLAKLKEVKDNHGDGISFTSPSGINNQEYILATYLLSQITGDAKDVMKEVDTELKKFTWLALLGEGAGGDVGEVMWLNKKCALKIIRSPNIEKEEKEVTILKRCHHPHIVKFFWYWEDKKSHIMMEWMPKNLYTHIKAQLQGKPGTPFKLHVAIDIMLQVANAMRYLHNEKIVHRDLKTLNILVEPITGCLEGYLHVKLADFGTAKPYNMTETFSTQTARQGTRAYAAPEVNFDQQVVHGDKSPKFPPKADVWSFAMVCSEILTGEPPFEGATRATLRAEMQRGLRPRLPDNCLYYLRLCITNCWELSPENRPDFSTICKNLMVAKAMSLGIIPLGISNHLFLELNKTEERLDDGASLPVESTIFSPKPFPSPSGHEMEVHEHNFLGYYLIGTYFTYYTDVSKNQEIFGGTVNYKTGIYNKGSKTLQEVIAIKFLFQSQEITIMEGSCLLEGSIAYGCLTGLFVDSQHLEQLKEKEIEVVQGGFIGERAVSIVRAVHADKPEIKKFFWGTRNSPTSGELAASFVSGLPLGEIFAYCDRVYLYLEYGSNKPALISHLWHGGDLVFGNKENSEFTSRHVLGKQIRQSSDHHAELSTYSLSIS
ncbi:hypothetical protein CY35_14G048500 [Sphagnum magellanicum]|nr:hypothetical protein CY35_14G048500 [Sphagnum magellanicum]KAH9541197.1 hypothetical protein CY35_14G048500 [Sphagnum magellanicum]